MARSLVKNVKEIDSCFLLLADDKYCASCAAEATCRDRRQSQRILLRRCHQPPTSLRSPAPTASTLTPAARLHGLPIPPVHPLSGSPVPGDRLTRCLFLNLEHLDNEHCNQCRRAWPGFVAPAAN